MNADELKELYNRRILEQAQQDEVTRRELAMHPYCGIIPSPEKLDKSYNSGGEDVTNTRGDFNRVLGWLSECPNIGFYREVKTTVDRDEHLELPVFKSAIHSAFQAFDPIRNTHSPEAEEMVLLYYTGHGLTPSSSGSSSPLLEKVGYSDPREYFAAAQPYITPNRIVKGGELCLHDVGFCDLEGLLEPWIAAVRGPSINRPGERHNKHNKHVVIIADSCYSGKLVEHLNELNQSPGPWNENDCTVTVQSACSSDEQTYGGYFTPCFVYYNQPDNRGKLDQLIEEWKGKIEIEKDAYREIELPCPQLATTRRPENMDSENNPVLKLSLQGFQLCLFRDAGFFKFCCMKHSIGALGPQRAPDTVEPFLFLTNFNIMDYKLKKMENGTPMALFLVHNPYDSNCVICVHIHFKNNSTEFENISGVNLYEHYRPTDPRGFFWAVNSQSPVRKFFRKDVKKYRRLVQQCMTYAMPTDQLRQRWENANMWNMKVSVHQKFRMQERSAWMDNYLEEIVP